MKLAELKRLIREEIMRLNESDDINIIAIFPGENKKHPYMFYYTVPDGSVWYVSGVGKRPVKEADSEREFWKMGLRATPVKGAKPAFGFKHPH